MTARQLVLVFLLWSCSKTEPSAPATTPPPAPAASPAAAATSPSTFVVELDPATDLSSATGDGIAMVEGFVVAEKSYAIFTAPTQDALAKQLAAKQITPRKVVAVRDVNSPVRGGGQAAGAQPREGHKTFVIERAIPGVGTFPDAKKEGIAKKSNAAVAQIGTGIEWDHSYLTDEGTYCVYRATGEDKIREHGTATGAPVTKLSEVQKVVRN